MAAVETAGGPRTYGNWRKPKSAGILGLATGEDLGVRGDVQGTGGAHGGDPPVHDEQVRGVTALGAGVGPERGVDLLSSGSGVQ